MGEGPSRKLKQVWLSEGTLKALEALKKVCMTAPILGFTNYSKPFLLETDASKDELEAVLSQKQMNGWYHPVAFGSRAIMPHKKNYHSMKLRVFGIEVDSYGTLQGVPTISMLPGKD